jgi:hypothetical protein
MTLEIVLCDNHREAEGFSGYLGAQLSASELKSQGCLLTYPSTQGSFVNRMMAMRKNIYYNRED